MDPEEIDYFKDMSTVEKRYKNINDAWGTVLNVRAALKSLLSSIAIKLKDY